MTDAEYLRKLAAYLWGKDMSEWPELVDGSRLLDIARRLEAQPAPLDPTYDSGTEIVP